MKSMKWKRIRLMASWLGIITYLAVALSFSSARMDEVTCMGVKIYIRDSVTNRFVSSRDVSRMLVSSGYKVIGQPIWSINTNLLEQKIEALKTIGNVEVYAGDDGLLRIDVSQRTPIIRVIPHDGGSFYIDKDGYIFPFSSSYTARVFVANGNIDYPTGVKNIEEMVPAEEGAPVPLLVMMYRFAKYVNDHDFWRAQIQQVFVAGNHDIELYTRVGNQSIQTGGLENFTYKLEKLYAFYQKGVPAVGWDTYKSINLKFSNQVVCTKR